MAPIEPDDIAPLSLRPGNVLRGKYRVERVLGAGGMGIVVAATHLRMAQRVAIKLLRSEAPNRGDLVHRFAREGRAASKLRGEHTVRILDVDDSDEGEPFLVMEYLEGRDLQATLTERGPLPIDEAVGYVIQACEGIAEAHALGIVHRDLKPANLFVTRRADGTPIVKILDFGISRAIEADAPGAHAITRPEAALGSPSYMSPEQLKDAASAGATTDLWALGVVLYQLLSGALPFEAMTAASLAARIASDPHKPIRTLRSEVPSGVADAIDRCLDKDPTKRFADAAALARALAPFAPGGESAAMRTARVTEEQTKRAQSVDDDSKPSPSRAPARAAATPNVTVSLHGETPGGPAKLVATEYTSSVAAEEPTQASAPRRKKPRRVLVAGFIAALLATVALGGIDDSDDVEVDRDPDLHGSRRDPSELDPDPDPDPDPDLERFCTESTKWTECRHVHGSRRDPSDPDLDLDFRRWAPRASSQLSAQTAQSDGHRVSMRALLTVLSLCAVATVSSFALAGEPSKPVESGPIVEARGLFRKGDYRGALNALERAQKIAPDPHLFWNMAACENKLGHHARAIAYVQRYVAAIPNLSEDQRKQADDFVRAANAYVGRVTVTSRLDGVRITIDDVFAGTTPLTEPLVLDEGAHRVRFERAGRVPAERTEQVLGGSASSWAVELTPEARASSATSPDEHPPNEPARSRTLPIVVGGAGLAVAATGALLAGISLSKAGELEDECSPACPPSRWKGARTMQIAGDVMFVVGTLALAGGIVLWFLPSKPSAKGATDRKLALSPALDGIIVRGTW